MGDDRAFRTARLTGLPPDGGAAPLYRQLFGPKTGGRRLQAHMQDWDRHAVAPWVLSHAGRPVGVGGFHIGFGDNGLEIAFHFLPEVTGQGLASEFVQGALDHATATWKEDRFFALVEEDNPAAMRILEKSGFRAEPHAPGARRLRLRIGPREARPSPRDG